MIKHSLLFFICVLFCVPLFGQDIPLSHGGLLDKVYDHYGNTYSLADININNPGKPGPAPALISCETNSYFRLFFETGCGMDDINDPVHAQRRAVVCQVFRDLSGFINSPLSGNNNRVNIWVRRINNVVTNPNNVLGVGSSFYVLPTNTLAGVGGIADNEIWKTIHTGQDSFDNVAAPLAPMGQSGNTGQFFHGLIAFNFNTDNTIPINWHTDLTQSTQAGHYDLYSAVLHEVTHALGVNSLIGQTGESIFGPNARYFNRYDTFLITNSNVPLITTGSACGLYNHAFNSSLSDNVLHPNPGNCSAVVSCANSIKFAGTTPLPVHTPNCWSQVSSLHHFEDQLFPTCTNPAGDDAYFLMCNSVSTGVTRRYLKKEERSALCDLGYSMNTQYGASTTVNGSYTGTYYYTRVDVCEGIVVAGINDGIAPNNTYLYVGEANTPITISGLLANDTNATFFECLEDITAASNLSTTSGTSGTNIDFSSAVTGMHLLRYIPVNGLQRGNITYVFVRVTAPPASAGCNPVASACDLIINGNFESHGNNLPTAYDTTTPSNPNNPEPDQFERACGWFAPGLSTPDYFYDHPGAGPVGVPCNTSGYEPDRYAAQGHKGYVGMGFNQIYPTLSPVESIGTRLSAPLAPGTTYQLSFDVSLAEFRRQRLGSFQAYITSIPPEQTSGHYFTDLTQGVFVTSNPASFPANTSGWQTITLTFTTGQNQTGLEYVYIGGPGGPTVFPGNIPNPNAVQFAPGGSPIAVSGCPTPGGTPSQTLGYYFVDNVSLVATGGATFDIPASICGAATLSDLTPYLASVATNGVFTGPGVSLTGGVYSFNSSVAGAGTHTISYTYNNSVDCPITLTDNILVNPATIPVFVKVGPRCAGIRYAPLPTTSVNGVTGTWALISSNPPAYTYQFTPTVGQCATTATMTVFVYPNVPVDAVDDNYTSTPISQDTGGVTPSVFANDFYDSALINGTTMQHVTVSIVSSQIVGATISSSGVITVPANAPIGTYTVTYQLSLIGCGTSDTATVTIFIDKPFTTTPVISNSVRANHQVNTIDLQGGKIIISGFFTTYNNIATNTIARLNTDLTLDTSFLATGPTAAGGMPSDVAVQSNHKVIVVGSFAGFNGGSNGHGLARLNFDGSVDTSFNSGGSGFNAVVPAAESCAIQTDQKILIGGYMFTTYNGVACGKVVRLNTDGSIDPSFTFPSVGFAYVRKIIVQTDGKILVLGSFTGSLFAPATNVQLFRVNADGSFDNTFTPSVAVSTGGTNCGNCYTGFAMTNMVLQPDGKIIAVGAFSSYNGLARTNIVRLTSSGAVDMTFNPSASTDRAILEVILEPMSNKLLVAGEFTSFSGTPVSKMIRLTTNGMLDTSFNIGSGTLDSTGSTIINNNIVVLKKQPDGKLITGGKFTSFNGITAGNITRIFGDNGIQSRGIETWHSEPEIDINHSDANVKVYPNPSRDVFNIDLGKQASKFTEITVYNLLGSAIYKAHWVNDEINSVDLSGLPTGYYIARIGGDKNIEVKLLKN